MTVGPREEEPWTGEKNREADCSRASSEDPAERRLGLGLLRLPAPSRGLGQAISDPDLHYSTEILNGSLAWLIPTIKKEYLKFSAWVGNTLASTYGSSS